MALDAGTAYFGTFDNEVLALDLKTHRFKWRYKHPEREFPFYSSAAVAAGKVVVGGRDKMIHAIDATSGKAVWTYMTRARVESSPAVAGSRVYVGSGDGRFYVLRSGDRRQGVGVRHGRAAVGVAGAGQRPGRHRVAGRTLGVLWVVSRVTSDESRVTSTKCKGW